MNKGGKPLQRLAEPLRSKQPLDKRRAAPAQTQDKFQFQIIHYGGGGPVALEPPRSSSAPSSADVRGPHPTRPDDRGALGQVLLICLPESLAKYLSQRHHRVVTVDKPEALAALPRARYDAIIAQAKQWPALHALPATAALIRYSRDVAIVAVAPGEPPANQVKFFDGKPANARRAMVQELVFSHVQNFIWQGADPRMPGLGVEWKKLEDDLVKMASAAEQANIDYDGLKSRVAQLTAAKTAADQALTFVTAECWRTRTKLVTARAAAAEAHTKAIVVKPYQDLELLSEALKQATQPREAVASVINWLLTDVSYAAVHEQLKQLLEKLSALVDDAPDFEDLVRTSGLDAVMQSWLLYEFSLKSGRPLGARSRQPAPDTHEKPLPLEPVADKSVVDSWGFAAFAFGHEELITLFMHMMERLDVLKAAGVPRNNLIRFLRGIAKSYREVPYHSFKHAMDVAQVAFKTMDGTVARQYLTDLDVFALMIAAVCHDVDHPGTSNAFQMADRTPLTMIYNDQSPLENHHASSAFYVAADSSCDIFAGMADETYFGVRTMIIKTILMTDMKNHADLQKQLSAIQHSGAYLSQKSLESRQFLVSMIVHLADLSNVCRPWIISKAWSDRVLDEYFQQGDQEKAKNYPVSANMDRLKTKQDAMTLGFIDFVVMPMMNCVVHLMPELQPLLENMRANRGIWAGMHLPPGNATSGKSESVTPRPGVKPASAEAEAATQAEATAAPTQAEAKPEQPQPTQAAAKPDQSQSLEEIFIPSTPPPRPLHRVRSRSAPSSPRGGQRLTELAAVKRLMGLAGSADVVETSVPLAVLLMRENERNELGASSPLRSASNSPPVGKKKEPIFRSVADDPARGEFFVKRAFTAPPPKLPSLSKTG
eukprot:TRINITY_DN937_c0_g2_i1.p1 TRINITY_DN937_c0_g2~~TRINITY_DN937_c0_g2_i1.p1  ORF type:complete len:883 (-),score=270.10 TRINITY_DN937_c0_g2_i1:246-2894(-)